MNWIDFFQSRGGIVLTGILGLVVGSFLNVVIYRLPIMMDRAEKRYAREILHEEENINDTEQTFNLLFPPSACPHCNNKIRFWQNIPVISYLIQKGKCAYCSKPVSIRYLLVELLCALLSILVVIRFPDPLALGFSLLFTWILLALIFIDAEQQLLPDILTLPLMWLGFIAALLGLFTELSDSVTGAACGYLILWSVYWGFKLFTGKEGMGYGDFKLLAAICAWQNPTMIPVILFIAALLGLLFALINQIKTGVAMAFGPYLAIAGWLTFMYGGNISTIFGFAN